jgi:hypothetical protein
MPDDRITRRQALLSGAGFVLWPSAECRGAISLPQRVIYYGRDEQEPASVELEAGPVSLVFEPELAFVRYVRLGDREILRGIYAAVRDESWLTIAPRVSNVVTKKDAGRFHVSFDVVCKEGPIDFSWKGAISGDSDGTVRFRMDGVANSTFLRNRIGICALHPLTECAGQPVRIEKTDGSFEEGRFPDLISPHQPFMDIRAMTYRVSDGVEAEIRFEGDVFEMEDHRNWTDANFKTYCTPLKLPFPVKVQAGTKVSQSVELRLTGKPSRVSTISRQTPIRLEAAAGEGRRLPAIGLGWSRTSVEELERLKLLQPAHLRIDLPLQNRSFVDTLRRASIDARAIESSLEIAIFLSASRKRELEDLAMAAKSLRPKVVRWLVFRTDGSSEEDRWIERAREQLSAIDLGARFGAGTNLYFAELNRQRPQGDLLDAVCYSINPQVHAFDNTTLVENLVAQASTVQSARAFTGKKWLAVTPVTLRPRFNPNDRGARIEPRGTLPFRVDPRQMSLFGAAWTLGSLKYLSEAGADSVTYYESVGWCGVMERRQGSPLPSLFRSIPNSVFPLYHVLADAADFRGGRIVPIRSSHPLRVDAALLRRDDRIALLLANFTGREQQVTLAEALIGAKPSMRILDESSFEEACTDPIKFRKAKRTALGNSLTLAPYSVVRIDSEAA